MALEAYTDTISEKRKVGNEGWLDVDEQSAIRLLKMSHASVVRRTYQQLFPDESYIGMYVAHVSSYPTMKHACGMPRSTGPSYGVTSTYFLYKKQTSVFSPGTLS